MGGGGGKPDGGGKKGPSTGDLQAMTTDLANMNFLALGSMDLISGDISQGQTEEAKAAAQEAARVAAEEAEAYQVAHPEIRQQELQADVDILYSFFAGKRKSLKEDQENSFRSAWWSYRPQGREVARTEGLNAIGYGGYYLDIPW